MRNRLIALFLSLGLFIPLPGQQAGWLKLTATEGEGAFNNIRQKEAHNPAIEIRDEQDRVVAGANVTFLLPYDGASGTFADGKREFTTTTDANGKAASAGLRPNHVEGRYNIKVSASFGGREGTLVISQSNTLAGGITPAQKSHAKTYVILGVIGAAGAGIGLGLGHGGGKNSSAPPPPTPTSVSVGSITVGGPQQ